MTVSLQVVQFIFSQRTFGEDFKVPVLDLDGYADKYFQRISAADPYLTVGFSVFGRLSAQSGRRSVEKPVMRGCGLGYLIGHPLMATEFEALLNQRTTGAGQNHDSEALAIVTSCLYGPGLLDDQRRINYQ